jgi:PPK2 family polyphosphate:nucleotide phosphotransferase
MTLCETERQKFSPASFTAKVKISEPLENLTVGSDLLKRFKIEPDAKVDLSNIDPRDCGHYESHEAALPEMLSQLHKMDQLQNLLYAERKRSVLVVLQGLDACGKDGVVRHIVTGMNPAGCRVIAFKQPTPTDLGHDFLWRVHSHAPAMGEVVVFNRSHYEDVLVVRVHELVPAQVWSKRYDLINELERLLVVENHTTVLKFFLYISKDEQLARFKRRLDDPARRWKISESDYREREFWDDYVQAFQDMLHKTSTLHAPWFVIPSNNKWFRDLAVSQIITRTLEQLDMQLPETAVDLARIRRRYHAAETEAKASLTSSSACEPAAKRKSCFAETTSTVASD